MTTLDAIWSKQNDLPLHVKGMKRKLVTQLNASFLNAQRELYGKQSSISNRNTSTNRTAYAQIDSDAKLRMAKYASRNGVTKVIRHFTQFKFEGSETKRC